MKKKFTAALLAALTLSSAAACGQTPADTPFEEKAQVNTDASAAETTTEETFPADLADDLPRDINLEGRNFVILSRYFDEGSSWQIKDIWTESENGERINDSVFQRNLQMYDRFGVTVSLELKPDVVSEVKKRISAGENSFDAIDDGYMFQAGLTIGGFILDLAALDYLDFSKAWWDRTAIDTLRYAGRLYFAPGCGQLNNYKGSWCTIFNKRITGDAGVQDLYQLVRDGGWTLAKLKTFGKMTARDLDGDGLITWGTDIYGIGTETGAASPYLHAAGVKFAEFSDDGSYTYSADSEKFVNAMEIIWNFMNTDNDCLVRIDKQKISNQFAEFRKLFKADMAAFYPTSLSTVTLISGEMESDFGLLPIPKTSESVDKYYSDVQIGNVYALSIPITDVHPDETAMLIEGYQMLSYDTVRPAYYDITLTVRSIRDTESEEMLELIFANRNIDLVMIYNEVTGLNSFILDAMDKKTFTYASDVASNMDRHKQKIDSMIEFFNDIGN
ncbi:MAG: hypothetical protein K6D94_11905 [Clostridiales bacterium]|nr:hypothetical protein [Clostridiales bacterium]